jgi:hypothetical protein
VAEDRIESVRKTLLAAPHVRAASIERGRLVVDTNDSDEVARQLLGPLAGTDLEIEAASLETAFIELTRTGGAA